MLRQQARGAVTGGGGGRREGACAGPLLSGERKRCGRGRVESLPEKQAAGVRWRAPDHYSLGSGVTKEGARGGVTAAAHQRRDERCRDRRGERRSDRRGQEQALLEGRSPALLEGGHRHYQLGRAPVLAQGATVSATGGDVRWYDRCGATEGVWLTVVAGVVCLCGWGALAEGM